MTTLLMPTQQSVAGDGLGLGAGGTYLPGFLPWRLSAGGLTGVLIGELGCVHVKYVPYPEGGVMPLLR